MKKITIFGATGMVGLCALEAALNSGLEVRALLRDPSLLPDTFRSRIEVVQGNVLNAQDVENALEGRDGVVVTLGTRNVLTPTTELSEGMKNIISAMYKSKVDVLSVCLSAFLFYDPEKVPPMFKDINEEHKRMYDVISASTLKWIAVFPPHIANTSAGKYIIKQDSSPGRAISKYDLGAFLVETLSKPENYNKVFGIATAS